MTRMPIEQYTLGKRKGEKVIKAREERRRKDGEREGGRGVKEKERGRREGRGRRVRDREKRGGRGEGRGERGK